MKTPKKSAGKVRRCKKKYCLCEGDAIIHKQKPRSPDKVVKAWGVYDLVGFLICAWTIKKFADDFSYEEIGRTVKEVEILEI